MFSRRQLPPILGHLDPWPDPRTSGILWSLHLDRAPDPADPYGDRHVLADGDHLTVWAADHTVAWTGVIRMDWRVGLPPATRRRQQQRAMGHWVHGIQQGFAPDDWAALFFHAPPLRGTVLPHTPRLWLP